MDERIKTIREAFKIWVETPYNEVEESVSPDNNSMERAFAGGYLAALSRLESGEGRGAWMQRRIGDLLDSWQASEITDKELERSIRQALAAPAPQGERSCETWCWECNECGSQEFTASVNEEDLDYCACSACGGVEFHKANPR